MDDVLTAWSPTRAARSSRLGVLRRPHVSLSQVSAEQGDQSLELGIRFAAMQVGYWLGWASIVVVLAGLTLDAGARHRSHTCSQRSA